MAAFTKIMQFGGVCVTGLMLQGCISLFDFPKPDDPKYAPPAPVHMRPPAANAGSLYQPGYSLALFEDRRAKRIGDILTINLIEQTQASKQSKTTIKKDNTTDISDATLIGRKTSLGPHNLGMNLEGKRQFDGQGDASQQNNLSGTITVSVVDILPNGYLKVSGEKWVTLNHGDEFIRLTGLIRPDDITAENTVESTRVANARITYSGRGQAQDANKMGWLARFFVTAFWPF